MNHHTIMSPCVVDNKIYITLRWVQEEHYKSFMIVIDSYKWNSSYFLPIGVSYRPHVYHMGVKPYPLKNQYGLNLTLIFKQELNIDMARLFRSYLVDKEDFCLACEQKITDYLMNKFQFSSKEVSQLITFIKNMKFFTLKSPITLLLTKENID